MSVSSHFQLNPVKDQQFKRTFTKVRELLNLKAQGQENNECNNCMKFVYNEPFG